MGVPAGERRIVSVLVADVAGSTSIAERLGPERSKFLFDDVVRLMREEVERFGGTVVQLTGDGVLALFGAPTAHEDDAERAVRAALALSDAVDRYGQEVGPAYRIELAARAAVNTGPVVVPAGNAPPDVLYNALGDTVNVAARLQQHGDVVVGPRTARQVDSWFELEELGRIELKGRSEPVAAFGVLGVREAPATETPSPLFGRDEELSALGDLLDGLLQGDGAIVSITGEPGIGKSRLLAELEERYAGRIRVLTGHAVAYAESIPYWPVREQLRAWLGLGLSDPEARVRLELRAALATALPTDAGEAYPFVANVLGLAMGHDEERRLSELARDAVQQETFYWLYRLVGALAGARPLCLVFEDLHWSDEATLALLDDLLPAVEVDPVVFVLVHRSDPDHPAWQLVDRARRRYRARFDEIELTPLTDADTRLLAEADFGSALPPALVELVAERTGGNPYFISETIRDLRERGALARDGGQLAEVHDLVVPAAVQEALQARLDRLDPEAREVITTAAVVGRSFGTPLLEGVLPRTRLRPTLSELQWLGLVVAERAGTTAEYRFRHGLVREVAYARLVEAERRRVHRQVGEALETLHRDSPGEVDGLLAHHFAAADDAERAADYLLRAAETARAAYADDEAIALYERALGFLDRIGDGDRARATLLKLAVTHHLAFDFSSARSALTAAFDRPAAAPARAEPTERMAWATGAPWASEPLAPGLTGSDLANWTIRNLFRGLVSIGRDFTVAPDLAERFSVSDDGLTYRFILRRDATWSDGEPVTAHDFAFTYARMREDAVVESAPWLAGVTATALDDRTLELRLAEPQNQFLYMLGNPALFAWPRHVYERRGPRWYAESPHVGNGPFVLHEHAADVRAGGRITLHASPSWHGSRGNVAEVVIELETSPRAVRGRWRDGHYDLCYDGLAALAGDLSTESTVVDRAPGGATGYLGFGASRSPLDDARVRRAFAHALDRRRLPLPRGTTPAETGGVLPPSIPGHSPRVGAAFDPARAHALLEQAAYHREAPEIELVHFAIEREEAAAVAAQLDAVGVRVRLVATSSVAEKTAAIDGGGHAYIWGCDAALPDPARGFLQPLYGTFSLYRDQRLDELLALATSVRDWNERLRLCREFERVWIGEQAAVVPLTYTDRLIWRRPWLEGMWSNAIARSSFAEAVVGQRP